MNDFKYQMLPLSRFLTEYKDLNTNNQYRPVAIGRYGIRTRESIYSKELAKDYSKNKLIYKDTLTVGMGSVQMDIGILTDDITYSVSPAYHTYRICGIDCDYLRFCLQARNIDMFTRYMKRGSRQGKSIDLKAWIEYSIPVYPQARQSEIVEHLNVVQSIIAHRQRQLQKLDELVKARFVEMFGDAENGESKYPLILLGDLATKISDGVHAKPQYTESGRPFLSVVNINQKKVDFTDCKFVSEDAYQKMIKSTHPEKGDVLYTKVGATYGIPAYVDTDIEFCLYVSVCLIKPDHHKINSRFLAIQMDTPFVKHQADKRIKGIGVPDLHLNQIREFQIVCPPRELQDKFVEFVKQIDKSKFVEIIELLNLLIYTITKEVSPW